MNQVHHHTISIDGLDIFYREAGPADAPAVLLLHGFPSSSSMFRNLIPQLATKYHVVAPDYPGFGQSSMPSQDHFHYTFANYADLLEKFTKALKLHEYALYVMDYGAPVGYRLALKAPQRVTALIVQNGNAYEEGLENDFWKPLKKYWESNNAEDREALRSFLKSEATKWQYFTGVSDPTLINPDAYLLDQLGLDRPGNQEIQLDLFYDYRMNVPLYFKIQQFFREYQPPTLIVWGKNDQIFPSAGATPYLRDLPDAELDLLDTGHFALETHGTEIGDRILQFFGENVKRK
ncbi:MAG TPA: alpha/beta hydrolase [Bryobacteraceae bacterium]|nr:alpha/beta hydrolase [Bryobacteraceae bacterium]